MSTNIWGEKLVEFIGHNGVGFKDGVSIRATNANPVASGLEAQLGSVCLWVDKAFIKTGPSDNDWTEIATQAFIDTVTTLINDHIADTTDAHDATAISSTNTLGANVELVLTALKNYKDLGLQSAYNGYPDITVDAVNPIKIKNIAGDTQPYPLQVRSNDEGDIYFAAGKDNTFVKNVTFSADPTKKIELTDNSNIKITDFTGTRLLKEQVEILHHQDFREDFPSTYLTASDASLTITDTAGDLTISGQYGVVTQSSASIGHYVESEVINVANEDWTRAPIRIDLVQGLSGGNKGDWVAQVYKSDDGVTYTAVNTTIPVTTNNQTDKLIFQLQSTTAYLKVRWTIVTADDAIDLNIGRIKITSEALPVGEQIVFGSLTLDAAGSTISIINPITYNPANFVNENFETFASYSSGVWTAKRDFELKYDTSFFNTSNNQQILFKVNGNTVRGENGLDAPSSNGYVGISGSYPIKAQDTFEFYSVAAVNASVNIRLNLTATAKADSVYVDGEIHGTIGEIVTQSGDSIPQGTLLADGSAVSRTTYAKLFGVIGTTYGVGDGSTTFNLPDYRGYFLRGWSTDATVDPSGPRAVGSAQTDAMQGHKHLSFGTMAGGYATGLLGPSSGTSNANYSTGVPTTDGTNGTPRTASETRPINKAVKYYIRYEEKTVLQIPVGNERENVYSARIANNGTATITSQSYPFIQSVSRVIAGEVLITFKAGFFSATPAATLVTEQNTNVDHHRIKSISTTSMSVVTQDSSLASADLNFSFVLQRQGADYREPTAFIANAVSITNHVTGGVEYPVLGETVDGKQVYARIYETTANISTTTTLANIDTSLIPMPPMHKITTSIYAEYLNTFSTADYTRLDYNELTGDVRIELIGGRILYAGTRLMFKYTKP